MWINNSVYREDMEFVSGFTSINWAEFQNKTVLITGGTGLIGSNLINSLLFSNEKKQLGIKIVALVRNLEKAKEKFVEQLKFSSALSFIEGSVENLPKIDMHIDYIIHGANPTASSFFVDYPIDTIKTAVNGTINMLGLAVKNKVDGFIYLSSMEVYGAPLNGKFILETSGTTLDTMDVRSCYPESKRLCEALCAGYASQNGVRATVIRLAQTFGPGVLPEDQRVFAEFARCVKNNQDIVLQTTGESKRCYIYTADAVTAILSVLTNGEKGNAYNAANTSTYCSILEMANMVAYGLTENKIKVCVKIDNKQAKKFSPQHCLKLGTEKINSLGWEPRFGLMEMYQRMIALM